MKKIILLVSILFISKGVYAAAEPTAAKLKDWTSVLKSASFADQAGFLAGTLGKDFSADQSKAVIKTAIAGILLQVNTINEALALIESKDQAGVIDKIKIPYAAPIKAGGPAIAKKINAVAQASTEPEKTLGGIFSSLN